MSVGWLSRSLLIRVPYLFLPYFIGFFLDLPLHLRLCLHSNLYCLCFFFVSFMHLYVFGDNFAVVFLSFTFVACRSIQFTYYSSFYYSDLLCVSAVCMPAVFVLFGIQCAAIFVYIAIFNLMEINAFFSLLSSSSLKHSHHFVISCLLKIRSPMNLN